MGLIERMLWICAGLLVAGVLAGWLLLVAYKLPRSPEVLLEALSMWPAFRLKWLGMIVVGAVLTGFMWLHSQRERMHGDARFANAGEIAGAGLAATSGLVLGMSPAGGYLIAERPGHAIGEAPPRSKKTTSWVIPTMLQWPGSVIAIDIKKEVFDITSGYRAKVGDVFVFDPGNEHGQTHRFNPLEGIALATDEAGRYDEIDRMAHVLLQNPKSGETHWVESARDLFKGVALHLGHGRASVCPSDVLHFLRSGEKPSAKIQRLREEGAIRSEKALGLLVSFATLADKEASSVLSTLLTGLNVYENPRVAAATAVSDFSFNDLRRKRSSIYLVSKYSDISRFGTLFASVFLRALSVLSREKPTPDEPLDVLLLMDEFANFGRMDYLLSAMAALAGYHIRIFIIVQSSHQVEERYSLAERRSIYEMCRYRAVYQPNALESSEEISKLLGTKTVTVRNRSMSMKGGSSTSIIEQARPLMLPQEVRRLGDDTVLIFAEGARPVKGRKSPFFADRLMKKRLYAAAPLPRSLSAPIETEIFVADFVAASTFIAQVEASANTSTELANF